MSPKLGAALGTVKKRGSSRGINGRSRVPIPCSPTTRLPKQSTPERLSEVHPRQRPPPGERRDTKTVGRESAQRRHKNGSELLDGGDRNAAIRSHNRPPMDLHAPSISDHGIHLRRHAIAVGGLTLLLVAAFASDPWAVDHLRLGSDAPARAIANAISRWMDWPWVLGVTALGALVAHFRRAAVPRKGLLSLLIAGALIGGSATLIRSTTGRTRPSAPVSQGWFGPRANGEWLIGRRDYNAFPSGHTATVAGLAALLILRRHRFAPLLVGATLLVGWARIAVGAHRPSDVVASLLLAGILIRPLARRLPNSEPNRTLAPHPQTPPTHTQADAPRPAGEMVWSA